jgi:hypothetical protein
VVDRRRPTWPPCRSDKDPSNHEAHHVTRSVPDPCPISRNNILVCSWCLNMAKDASRTVKLGEAYLIDSGDILACGFGLVLLIAPSKKYTSRRRPDTRLASLPARRTRRRSAARRPGRSSNRTWARKRSGWQNRSVRPGNHGCTSRLIFHCHQSPWTWAAFPEEGPVRGDLPGCVPLPPRQDREIAGLKTIQVRLLH